MSRQQLYVRNLAAAGWSRVLEREEPQGLNYAVTLKIIKLGEVILDPPRYLLTLKVSIKNKSTKVPIGVSIPSFQDQDCASL